MVGAMLQGTLCALAAALELLVQLSAREVRGAKLSDDISFITNISIANKTM